MPVEKNQNIQHPILRVIVLEQFEEELHSVASEDMSDALGLKAYKYRITYEALGEHVGAHRLIRLDSPHIHSDYPIPTHMHPANVTNFGDPKKPNVSFTS